MIIRANSFSNVECWSRYMSCCVLVFRPSASGSVSKSWTLYWCDAWIWSWSRSENWSQGI